MQYGGEKPRMQTQVSGHPLPATGQPPGSPEERTRGPGSPPQDAQSCSTTLAAHQQLRSKEDTCPRRGRCVQSGPGGRWLTHLTRSWERGWFPFGKGQGDDFSLRKAPSVRLLAEFAIDKPRGAPMAPVGRKRGKRLHLKGPQELSTSSSQRVRREIN